MFGTPRNISMIKEDILLSVLSEKWSWSLVHIIRWKHQIAGKDEILPQPSDVFQKKYIYMRVN